MSLFKVREFWATYCSNNGQFDQNCLKIVKLNTHFDYVICGSHDGILHIFSPVFNSNGYKPTDMILEKNCFQPILQIDTGRLVSGSQKIHIAILYPRNISVYDLQMKEGATAHGNQYSLQSVYEHKLKRTSANCVVGPFGNAKNRDFICVQSLDGLLSFFEQESFIFCCFIPEFLLPGPFLYISKNDSFVTSTSSWSIECYRYKALSEVSACMVQSEDVGKKAEYTWKFNLSEPVLDMKSCIDRNRNVYIMVLGEKSFYCLGENGRQKYMKKLDYLSICFTCYVLDEDEVFSLIVSDTGTLLVYQTTTKKWSAQLTFTPVTIQRAFFESIQGALVWLSEEGFIQCCYLGTDPNIFVAPPLKNQELDFERTDFELITLNKVIQNSYSKDKMKMKTEPEDTVLISVNQQLEPCKFDSKLKIQNSMSVISIIVSPKDPINELQTTVLVSYPLKAEPPVVYYSNFHNDISFEIFVYVDDNIDIPSLEIEVIVSYILSTGMPKIITKKENIYMNLLFELCEATKENKHKIVLNTNKQLLPLPTIFNDFSPEKILGTNGSNNMIGFKNKFNEDILVSILATKSFDKYRIQSDSITSLNVIVEQFLNRIRKMHANIDVEVTYTSSLPVAPVIKLINKHFKARQMYNKLMCNLCQLGVQFRLIQKQFVFKFKTKKPSSLSNLELLLDDIHSEITYLTKKVEGVEDSLNKIQNEISCVFQLTTNLVRLTHVVDEILMLTESTFSSCVNDIDGQNWEDTMDASLCYLLRTVLASSDKDRLRAPHSSFEEIKDIEKVEKHLTHVLERIIKKMPVIETHFDVNEEKSTDDSFNLVPIGSMIAETSTRLLLARESLIRKQNN